MSIIIGLLVIYCALDFVLGVTHGRCVLPGLRCWACRKEMTK